MVVGGFIFPLFAATMVIPGIRDLYTGKNKIDQ